MNLLKAAAKVSSMTFISRILGFMRDALIARWFGAGLESDAFFTAFKLPNLLRRVFAEGAFSQAFVPVLAEYKVQRSEAETRALIAHVTGLLSLILLIITAIGITAASWIVMSTANGFQNDPHKFVVTVQLLRLTFPYILFISLASLAGSILNSYRQFSIPAFTPTLLNISMIACGFLLRDSLGIYALGIGVLLGGVTQLAFQLPYLRKLNMLPMPRIDWQDSGVWRIVKQMGPAIFAVSISQISLVINTNFASLLADGSVSWMYFADRLMEFPTGMLGVALGTILLPSLSKHHANKDTQEYSNLLDWGLRLCLLLSLPCAAALIVVAQPMVSTLFFYGKFSAHSVDMTTKALMAYGVGLLGLMLIKVLAPGFYAKQDIKTPVKIGIATLIFTQCLNIIFIFPIVANKLGWSILHTPRWLAHIWQLQHAGLALSISLAACANAALLLYLLHKRQVYRPKAGWAALLSKLGLATGLMSVALWLISRLFGTGFWLDLHSVYVRIGALSVVLGGGGAVYFGTLYLLGFRPRDFSRQEAH